MAAAEIEQSDPLALLRRSIALERAPIPATTPDVSTAADVQQNLAIATYLQFNHDTTHRSISLSTPTRFISSSDKPVDLRSIYFAWQHKDTPIPDYIAATQRLNDELSAPGGAGGKVQNLVFVEKLDLITWLEGASDESEYIKPLVAETVSAQVSAEIAAGTTGGIAPVSAGVGAGIGGAKALRTVDPRLTEIYNGERKMGDRNSVLRGIKPTDFSHIRKSAEAFLGRRPHGQRPGAPGPNPPLPTPNPALVSNLKKPSSGRRVEPIILLSPSASSLLRMSNIKQFLESGIYVPPDSAAASSTSSASILHIARLLPSVDPIRPLRFILVDSSDQFKPDYWGRLVAVFTTGQTWQFKSYKWTDAAELFRHVMGIYVGWAGEEVPATVRGWGRGVKSVAVDKWNPHQGASGRWRDREVVEGIWRAVEESMRAKGWGKDGVGR